MAIEESAHLIFTSDEGGIRPTEHWGDVFRDFRLAGKVENAGVFLGTLVVGELGFTDLDRISAGRIAEAFTTGIELPLTPKDLEKFKVGVYAARVAWACSGVTKL